MAEHRQSEPPQDAPALYEVMVETFGAGGTSGQPQFSRGDLIRATDAPDFDLSWAVAVGAVRFAPEYEGRGLTSTTSVTGVAPSRDPAVPVDAAAQAEANAQAGAAAADQRTQQQAAQLRQQRAALGKG